MINILKLSGELGTALSRDKFFRATIKLTIFYVLSTAVILFISSAAVLFIFAPSETELPSREEGWEEEIPHDEWSVDEIREHLPSVVTLVDITILLIVSIFSYYFAKRTLAPIESMHKQQTQFMGDVAHELRTPLAVLQAGADVLAKKQRSAAEYQEFITDVQEETGRLTRLTNQLLELLKTEQVVTQDFKAVDVSELVTAEIKRFIPYAAHIEVTIEGTISPRILLAVPADSFTQILQNLLKNAIDYNKPHGEVSVTLKESESNVCLEVTDTGIGIEPLKQKLLFERFVKVAQARTQTSTSGAGLGLSIVKALVLNIGGEIKLQSTPGIGTSVTVYIPKNRS
jgi:two-component system sensor histidine kinase CiaH